MPTSPPALLRPRTLVLLSLMLLPVLVYLALGGYTLWQSGVLAWVWWLLPVCWGVTWIVARLWKTEAIHEDQSIRAAGHWTDRDRKAVEIVHAFQRQVDSVSMQQLTDPHFYVDQVKSLSLQLAQHYHPQAEDPFSARTAPEVVAAVRLAIDDLERWMLKSAPGSRMLTIKQWRMLQHAPKWLQRLQQAGWAASILINPANIASYYSSKVTIQPVTTELQTELLTVIYLRFLRQMGFYLIEMNSGRLRAGADAYRHAFARSADASPQETRAPHPEPSPAAATDTAAIDTTAPGSAMNDPAQPRTRASGSDPSPLSDATEIRIALVGQVNAGKSSLINLLTGADHAQVDSLPATRQVQQVRFEVADSGVTMTLLDTPGYGEAGASAGQLEAIESALRTADAVLLIMDAHSPARKADVQTLQDVTSWYQQNPQFKQPPVLGVLTHVDLLPPALQWDPPYDWKHPTTVKAERIAAAVAYARELFGASLVDVIPVCSATEPSRRWGIVDSLLPKLTNMLDDAHATALLRAFEQRLDEQPWRTLLRQIKQGSGQLLQAWIDERLSPKDSRPS
jgi:uncharacterized protein